ncbi:regulatory protein, luxR family [Chryseobacterium arachidis]|uniref:Regulatory protein, luxR family n=1 Tax=Chryseobacterium arachidis TaxID=1416778 RepID=A0A1M5FT55_9FLAO|nr:LuxR C-terminal-related transcriptional regulator [Chryseobacterium arachidis]SHF94646.1 regulatory protein, luxR family [Chryseobacterium arachidis]
MGYVSNTSGVGSVDNQGRNTSCEMYYNALKVLGRTGVGCIYIIDLKNEKLEFISENPSLFAGLHSKEVEKIGYRFFRKYARAEDLKILKAVNSAGFKFFECLTSEEKKQHTIAYDFHIKSVSTVDVLVNHKITPIEVSEEGDISKMVCIASYALSKTAGNICISSNISDVYWCYNLDTEKWSGQNKITLKPREIEIIRLYLQGLKIEEIAQQLFVSPTTVKFHRSKLFEKIGVSNITEAISYVISNNLI